MKYEIVQVKKPFMDDACRVLEETVKIYIEMGYIPQGGVSMSFCPSSKMNLVAQAMVKED